MSKRISLILIAAVLCGGVTGYVFAQREGAVETNPHLVKTYDELATALLALNSTEKHVVMSILADAHDGAVNAMEAALQAFADDDRDLVSAKLEEAATWVGLIASEGNKSVALVRNRLLEGGHHHHANQDVSKKYDPGFVVVEKTEKQELLGVATALGKLAATVKDGAAGAEAVRDAMAEIERVWQNAID